MYLYSTFNYTHFKVVLYINNALVPYQVFGLAGTKQ